MNTQYLFVLSIYLLFISFPAQASIHKNDFLLHYEKQEIVKTTITIIDYLMPRDQLLLRELDLENKESSLAVKENELSDLQSKNDSLTKILYLMIGGLCLFTTGLLLFVFRQRARGEAKQRSKEEAIFQKELQFKKQELSTQTLHLVQKNKLIQEVESKLVKLKRSPKLFDTQYDALLGILEKEKTVEKDWATFQSYFSEVHNGFESRIKNVSEEVTENEIRLAAFLLMDLSTKEIASIQNVLPNSVLKSKYRLKQKLNLAKDEDLMKFLKDA